MKAVFYAAVVTAVALATSASAHHSYAMYDLNTKFVLTGTVSKWQWTNPHSELFLMVDGKDGKAFGTPEEWRLEGESPEVMRGRFNMRRDQIKVGDKLTVLVNPLRTGLTGGRFLSITLSDGTTLPPVKP
jgi:Family of unknown function (DUF6152)